MPLALAFKTVNTKIARLSSRVVVEKRLAITNFETNAVRNARANQLLLMRPWIAAGERFAVHRNYVKHFAFTRHAREHRLVQTANGNEIVERALRVMLQLMNARRIGKCRRQPTAIMLHIFWRSAKLGAPTHLNCRNFLPLASIVLVSRCTASTRNGSGIC